MLWDSPFSDDIPFTTYSRGGGDFSVESLVREDINAYKGFVNYKFMQGT